MIYSVVINPYDVLMFRESRSFEAGSSHVARSTHQFYSAVAGAIRSLIYNITGGDANKLIGVGEEEPGFEIIGGFYGFKEKPFFSIPGDVVSVKLCGDGTFKEHLCTVCPSSINWGKEKRYLLSTKKGIDFKALPLKYISSDSLRDHLMENVCNKCSTENFFGECMDIPRGESRVGIKLGESRTVAKGLFYRANFTRLHESVSIVVWIRNDKYGSEAVKYLKERTILKLGGESRFARYSVGEASDISHSNFYVTNERKVRFYFATPVVIKRGETDIVSYLQEEFSRVIKANVRIVGILGRKPYHISGWDMYKKSPKPNRYVLPAGTVVFAEINEDYNVEDFIKVGELKKLGFGLVFMGVWKNGGYI